MRDDSRQVDPGKMSFGEQGVRMSDVESQDVEFRREPVEVLGLWREARDLLWPEPYWLFMGICVVGIMIALLLPAVQQAREAA